MRYKTIGPQTEPGTQKSLDAAVTGAASSSDDGEERGSVKQSTVEHAAIERATVERTAAERRRACSRRACRRRACVAVERNAVERAAISREGVAVVMMCRRCSSAQVPPSIVPPSSAPPQSAVEHAAVERVAVERVSPSSVSPRQAQRRRACRQRARAAFECAAPSSVLLWREQVAVHCGAGVVCRCSSAASRLARQVSIRHLRSCCAAAITRSAIASTHKMRRRGQIKKNRMMHAL